MHPKTTVLPTEHKCNWIADNYWLTLVFLTIISILIFNLGAVRNQSLFTVLGRIHQSCHANRLRKGNPFFWEWNELYSHICRETAWHFHRKDACENSMCFITLCTTCSTILSSCCTLSVCLYCIFLKSVISFVLKTTDAVLQLNVRRLLK